MNLRKLDDNELKSYFLRINARYLDMMRKPFSEYATDPEYLQVQKLLDEVLNELYRRRKKEDNQPGE